MPPQKSETLSPGDLLEKRIKHFETQVTSEIDQMCEKLQTIKRHFCSELRDLYEILEKFREDRMTEDQGKINREEKRAAGPQDGGAAPQNL